MSDKWPIEDRYASQSPPACPLCGHIAGGMKAESNEGELLRLWLAGNESRIAKGEDSLGLLRSVFKAVIGREANG